MERVEYERLAAVEDRMWWTRALRRNLRAAIAPFTAAPDTRLLDAGCGTGGFLAALAQGASFGLDRDGFACRIAHNKTRRPVAQGSIDNLPFRPWCASKIGFSSAALFAEISRTTCQAISSSVAFGGWMAA